MSGFLNQLAQKADKVRAEQAAQAAKGHLNVKKPHFQKGVASHSADEKETEPSEGEEVQKAINEAKAAAERAEREAADARPQSSLAAVEEAQRKMKALAAQGTLESQKGLVPNAAEAAQNQMAMATREGKGGKPDNRRGGPLWRRKQWETKINNEGQNDGYGSQQQGKGKDNEQWSESDYALAPWKQPQMQKAKGKKRNTGLGTAAGL